MLRDALAWKESGKDKALLYTGEKLDSTLADIEDYALLEPTIKEFLDAGGAEQAVIEEKQRRRKMSITALSVGLLFAVALSVFSFIQWGKANDSAVEAKRNAEHAEMAKSRAENEKKRADLQVTKANYHLGLALNEKAKTAENKGDSLFAHLYSLHALIKISKGKGLAAYQEALFRAQANSVLQPNFISFYHNKVVENITFSPDGRTLASGSWDNTIGIWDMMTGKLLHTLEGHTSRVHNVSFSPDGILVASGASDKTICIWEVATGKLTKKIENCSSEGIVSFSSDSVLLASGSDNNNDISIWN
ncbi:MAG: hypothetical protein D3925_03110, partial [Candidatus Electrothrix sp. AR5]|nr:hypothetical protein [Candidatus Electrothrix sp. AR5]